MCVEVFQFCVFGVVCYGWYVIYVWFGYYGLYCFFGIVCGEFQMEVMIGECVQIVVGVEYFVKYCKIVCVCGYCGCFDEGWFVMVEGMVGIVVCVKFQVWFVVQCCVDCCYDCGWIEWIVGVEMQCEWVCDVFGQFE